jgi:hypothetical protein
MGVGSIQKNNNSGNLYSRRGKYQSRLSLQDSSRSQRLEVEPNSVSKVGQIVGTSSNKHVCISSKSPSGSFLQLETITRGNSSGCIQEVLERFPRMGKSPLQFNRKSTIESTTRSGNNNFNCTSLDHSRMVPSGTTSAVYETDTAPRLRGSFLARSVRECRSDEKSQLESTAWPISGEHKKVEAFQRELWDFWQETVPQRGHSEHTILLGRNSQSGSIARVLETGLFHQLECYSSINNFRTAISVTAPQWEGHHIGQDSLIIKCMSRIDKERPSLPAYTITWVWIF